MKYLKKYKSAFIALAFYLAGGGKVSDLLSAMLSTVSAT